MCDANYITKSMLYSALIATLWFFWLLMVINENPSSIIVLFSVWFLIIMRDMLKTKKSDPENINMVTQLSTVNHLLQDHTPLMMAAAQANHLQNFIYLLEVHMTQAQMDQVLMLAVLQSGVQVSIFPIRAKKHRILPNYSSMKPPSEHI